MRHIGRLCIEDAAELIAWYVTEGSIHKNGKALNICQSKRVNPLYHAQIMDLLSRIGFSPKPRGRDSKDIVVCSVELCDWLLAQCGAGSAHKYLPAWLKECDEKVLQIVFDTMIAGDGWDNGPSVGYRSISKHLRADISEIAVKLGKGATEFGECVSISQVQTRPTINSMPSITNYKGRIYCVSVPNSNVLVRRNGRSAFSGNSYRPQKIVEQLEGGTKPDILAIGHFHKAEWMPAYRNVCVLQSGAFQWQTPFMRDLGLAAHVGGWIIKVTMGKSAASYGGKFIAFYR